MAFAITYGHGVSGDIVLLAVLDHLLQVWAVVRLSICDYNHYSLCPFPATFLKRFRAAIEEMPWAAQPRQATAPTAARAHSCPDVRPITRIRTPRGVLGLVALGEVQLGPLGNRRALKQDFYPLVALDS